MKSFPFATDFINFAFVCPPFMGRVFCGKYTGGEWQSCKPATQAPMNWEAINKTMMSFIGK